MINMVCSLLLSCLPADALNNAHMILCIKMGTTHLRRSICRCTRTPATLCHVSPEARIVKPSSRKSSSTICLCSKAE